jgi:cytochrome c-type biogenesis protein CcsB
MDMKAWIRNVLMAAALVLGIASAGVAQSPPAGNAHPETQALTDLGQELPNPFGDPKASTPVESRDKHAFAKQITPALDQLRTLAVLHDGRVKIVDTLARETVVRIVGRKAYQDVLPPSAPGQKPTKLNYDPLFTWLDLMIDPVYYFDKPLIHVEYLPLRRAFLEEAFPPAPNETPEQTAERERKRERWLMLTRISPVMVAQLGSGMQQRYDMSLPHRKSLNEIALAFDLLQQGQSNLLMVAPMSREAQYRHLATLPGDSPIRAAAAKLGDAWRARDAAGVQASAAVLATELPKINPDVYPTSRRNIEHAYNRSNAFEYGYWLYALALLTLILAFGTGRRWLIGLGVGALTLAVGFHAFGFVTRCIVAERFAIQNQFESMTGVSLFAAVVGLGMMLAKRQWLYGAAVAGVGFLILITATQTAIPGKFIEREAAILNTSVLLKYHVTTVLCSYGLISLGFIVSLFYLGTHYAAKFRTPAAAAAVAGPAAPVMVTTALNLDGSVPAGPARTLHDLDKAQMTVLQLAFWTLGVGILLGAWWADHSWGRWWAFDPKETWALVTWIIYLIVIHVRFTTGHNRGLVTAWLSVVGFLMMLWTYFGVNLLLPGLHAYA